jgi:hypothetical protein
MENQTLEVSVVEADEQIVEISTENLDLVGGGIVCVLI